MGVAADKMTFEQSVFSIGSFFHSRTSYLKAIVCWLPLCSHCGLVTTYGLVGDFEWHPQRG